MYSIPEQWAATLISGELKNSSATDAAGADVQGDMEAEVDAYLRRKYTTAIRDVETVLKEDLDLKNHLSGLKRKLLKVCPQLNAPVVLLQ